MVSCDVGLVGLHFECCLCRWLDFCRACLILTRELLCFALEKCLLSVLSTYCQTYCAWYLAMASIVLYQATY